MRRRWRRSVVGASTGYSASFATACMTVRSANVRDERIPIFRKTARKVRGCGCTRVVLHAPKDEFDHYWQEIDSFRGLLIDNAPCLGRISRPAHHSHGLEPLQSAPQE